MLIDTHCHLNFAAFEKDLDDVVRRAREKGVEKIIIPGTDIVSSRRAVEIAQAFPGCFAAIGIHPHHAQDPDFQVNDQLRKQLEKLITGEGSASAKASADKIVAVGEIGLDYYRYTKTKYENTVIAPAIKHKQQELFLMQLELALIHNKPVIFHCREAHDDMVEIVSKLPSHKATASHSISRRDSPTSTVKTNYIPAQGWSASGGKPHQLKGVWHCFGGNAKQLQDIITMGYYIGFDGNITYNKTQYSPLVASAPLNRILLETDSPFLTPVPHRGTRNEPAFLPYVAQAVADYHATPLSEVIHLSTNNAQSLFSLP